MFKSERPPSSIFLALCPYSSVSFSRDRSSVRLYIYLAGLVSCSIAAFATLLIIIVAIVRVTGKQLLELIEFNLT